eukprot:TRINITY_DN11191_c0_g1_i1.p2 TRINITY_DN11191_c0_g1~~TRINITY_DN11191_c0_g1_i1.p2  ORF type:complete len:320 (-),score=119.69 TRINITY_DN11191_c0_g1_i1:92-1006(-)
MALSRALLLLVAVIFLVAAAAASQDPDTVGRSSIYYAAAAYCPETTLEGWKFTPVCASIQSGFTVAGVWYVKKTDALGYVSYNVQEKTIVIAFKGTNPSHIRDWIDDLSGMLHYATSCVVGDNLSFKGSTGFCGYYLSLRNAGLFTTATQIISQFPDFQILVVGHSLGGAAANVAALDLLYNYNATQTVNLITYGEPRVADDTGVTLFEQAGSRVSVFRFIHHRDIVPHLPPCCDVNGQCTTAAGCPFHQPQEIWYQDNMNVGAKYKECSTTNGEDPTCADSVIGWSIPDHLTYFNVDVGGSCC